MGTTYSDDNQNIDSITALQYMLEHSRLSENRYGGEIDKIVSEELQAFFAEAKSAKETAEVIDNRVQLYLDENF